MLDRVRQAVFTGVPELRDNEDPDLLKACRRSFAAGVHAVLAHLSADAETRGSAPLEMIHHAVLWARRELPPDVLLRSYTLAQHATWDEVLATVDEVDPPPALRHEVVARASALVLGYSGDAMIQAMAAHDAERGEQNESPERRRVRLVENVLDGNDRSVALGYDLNARHLAFLTWGEDPMTGAAALRAHIDRPMLIVQPNDQLVWGWVGGLEELSRQQVRLIFHHAVASEASFAFGTLQSGIDGFATSFEHARHAHRFGSRCDRKLTVYKDVALEALCLRNEEHARSFMHEQLGPLANGDAKSVALRQTLSAYFEKANNAASCAVALGVHEGTVAYRLRSIEKLLGHPIAERRAELEVGLRLVRILGD